MADTERTLAQLLALFADGQGANEITPQDMRDLIVSMHLATQNTVILDETTTPTAIANSGQLYTKTDNTLYFQDGAGSESAVYGPSTPLSYKGFSFNTAGFGAGTYWAAGFYELTSTDANLTQASQTVNVGSANSSYAAHLLIVAGGVGASNKTTGNVRLTVTGTSINDAGTRSASDSEVLLSDVEDAGVALNAYFETSKKWIGQVTVTLENDGTGDATTFSLDFNYGWCKYEDFGNIMFNIDEFDITGHAGANDNGFDVALVHHTSSNWVYNATAFVAPTANDITSLASTHSTEGNLDSNQQFAFKRTGLNTDVDGSASEGVVIRIVTTSSSAVDYATANIGIRV